MKALKYPMKLIGKHCLSLGLVSLDMGPLSIPGYWSKIVFSLRQIALSTLFLSPSYYKPAGGSGGLLQSCCLSPPWPHFPTRGIVVILQHSLKKSVVQFRGSEQCSPPPNTIPSRGREWSGEPEGSHSKEGNCFSCSDLSGTVFGLDY